MTIKGARNNINVNLEQEMLINTTPAIIHIACTGENQ